MQQGMEPETIDPDRQAILHGQVRDMDGNPLAGVTVSVLGHPEYGTTISLDDGRFFFVVNGGARFVLDYKLPGYLPAQRALPTKWQNFEALETVVLVALDPNPTVVDMASPDLVAAAGSRVTDADGERQAVVMFPPGNVAVMTLPDGTTQELPRITVRATEYTVGENGPEAMPGELPENSGYTYAVELSVDEAIAAGAQRVDFDVPVPFYLENFLEFPVGGIVPAGYYDRALADWVPSSNGLIVAILSIEAGRAVLDLDGSGMAASDAELDSLGVTTGELEELAGRYLPGQTLWRVPISHFTPWDCNWPWSFEADAWVIPEEIWAQITEYLQDGCHTSGSVIDCNNQSLGEVVGISGAPFSLVYNSDRTKGITRYREAEIQLSGPDVPDSLLRIELKVSVAGKVYEESFEPEPNLSTVFAWDGLDAFDREWNGSASVDIDVKHVFQAVPVEPGNFDESFRQGSDSGAVIGRSREEGTVSLTTSFTTTLRGLGTHVAARKFGGWSVDVHHVFDVLSRRVYFGNAEEQSDSELGKITDIIAEIEVQDFSPAVSTTTNGDVFVAHVFSSGAARSRGQLRIEKVSLGGERSVVYEGDVPGSGFNSKTFQVLDDGLIQLEDWDRKLYRSDGFGGFSELSVEFDRRLFPESVSLNSLATCVSGEFYALGVDIQTEKAPCVLRLQKNGASEVVVGNCNDPDSAAEPLEDGAWARGVDFGFQWPDIFCDQQGRLQIVDQGLGVFTLNGDGRLAQLAPAFPSLDRGRVDEIRIAPDNDVAYSVRISDDKIARVDRYLWHSATDVTVFGVPDQRADLETGLFDGRLALSTEVAAINSFGWDGGGNMIVSNRLPGSALARTGASDLLQIARLAPAFSWQRDDRIYTLSKDGSLRYVFSQTGRHLETVHAVTGAVLLEFGYDGDGLLTSIIDADSEVTTIERGPDGFATAIVSHDGQRTGLDVDGNGDLAHITNPIGEEIACEYENGLLTKFTNPRGHSTEFTYNPDGSFDRDTDAVGGFKELTVTRERDIETEILNTALGRRTEYVVDDTDPNAQVRRVVQPDGTESVTTIGKDGSRKTVLADGTILTQEQIPDPRYGMKAPFTSRAVAELPSGLTSEILQTREVEETDAGELIRITETTIANGRTSSSVYDAAALTEVFTSPEGRQGSVVVDAQGRILESHSDGLASTVYTRDSRGRVTSVRGGEGADARTTIYDYFESGPAKGYLELVTDNLGRETRYVRDGLGRIEQLIRPDGKMLEFDYDEWGNQIGITPAGRPEHEFSYTPVDLTEDYTPPSIGPGAPETSYTYNLDRQIETVTLPDGREITSSYDPVKGRLDDVTTPRGVTQYVYEPGTGKVSQIIGDDGATLGFTYDGTNLLTETWAGEVEGTVAKTFDNNGWMTSRSVNGDAVTFDHDDDGLLTKAGEMSITSNPVHGLLDATSLGKVTSSHAFTQFAELAELSYSFDGSSLLKIEITERDKIGRIKQRVETIDGVSTTFDYEYSEIGRLTEVWEDGSRTEVFDYDPNGNDLNASTDDQDRLLALGGESFTYSRNGDLETRTKDGQTTTYDYDVAGGLRGVDLPDGTEIRYLLDPTGRRIGKKVDGVLTKAWLYADALNPIAELDGDGNIVARFIYGTQSHAPDYMVKDGQSWRILTDERGSTILVVNSETGEVGQRLKYDVWGKVLEDSNPGFQPFAFAGGLLDPDTGLIRFGARDYDPTIRRWTTKDPIRFEGGMNMYAYVSNDPINAIDPEGLVNILVGGGVTAAAPTGAETSASIVINPGFGDQKADVGIAVSVGATVGLNVSGDVYIGLVEGDISNVSGPTVNQNFTIGRVSITTIHNPSTMDIIGATIGIGEGMPAGYSVAYSHTEVATVRGVIDGKEQWELGGFCPVPERF